jgi:hypothetical protein
MIPHTRRGGRLAIEEGGRAGAQLVVLCALLAVLAGGAAAQDPMPTVSPLKPVKAVHDSIPLPVIEDPVAEGFQELIVELRAGQEVSRSEFAFARDGHVWIPALSAFEIVELPAEVDDQGALHSILEPDRLGLNLFSREMEVWRGNYYRLTHEHDLFFHDGVFYAKAVDLAWVLDVRLYEDFVEMAVIFDGIDQLPLGRRLRRERMRRLDEMFSGEPDIVYGLDRPAWSGATLDWNVGVPSFQLVEQSALGLGFGGALFGGAMDARYRGRLDGRGREDFDARWQGVWPDQVWLRQLEVGATRATGPRGRSIDGIAVGNSPFLRSSEFGETVLRGQLDPGWEVEVYRNGRLLAWDRVDDRGYWEFTVPLDYGQNPVEVRAYGPNGEVQITERAVRVDFDRIPEGNLEYGLSAGRTEYRSADFSTNADLRYGINTYWTARAGYDGYRLVEGGSAHHPYLSLTGTVLGPLRVGGERVVDAWWWSGVSLEPSSDFRVGLQHFRYDQQGQTGLLVNPGDRERTGVDVFWRPVRERRNLFFDFNAERIDGQFDRRSRFSVGGTSMIHRVRTSVQLKEEFDRVEFGTFRRSAVAVQASTVLRSMDRRWWHGIQARFQSELDVRNGLNDWFQVSVGRNVGPNARLEVGGGWYRVTDSAQFTIGLSSTGSHAYVNAWMNGRNEQGVKRTLRWRRAGRSRCAAGRGFLRGRDRRVRPLFDLEPRSVRSHRHPGRAGVAEQSDVGPGLRSRAGCGFAQRLPPDRPAAGRIAGGRGNHPDAGR